MLKPYHTDASCIPWHKTVRRPAGREQEPCHSKSHSESSTYICRQPRKRMNHSVFTVEGNAAHEQDPSLPAIAMTGEQQTQVSSKGIANFRKNARNLGGCHLSKCEYITRASGADSTSSETKACRARDAAQLLKPTSPPRPQKHRESGCERVIRHH